LRKIFKKIEDQTDSKIKQEIKLWSFLSWFLFFIYGAGSVLAVLAFIDYPGLLLTWSIVFGLVGLVSINLDRKIEYLKLFIRLRAAEERVLFLQDKVLSQIAGGSS